LCGQQVHGFNLTQHTGNIDEVACIEWPVKQHQDAAGEIAKRILQCEGNYETSSTDNRKHRPDVDLQR